MKKISGDLLNPTATMTELSEFEDVPSQPTVKNQKKLKVWGGITSAGETKLLIYEGALTGQSYRDENLKKSLPQLNKLLLVFLLFLLV